MKNEECRIKNEKVSSRFSFVFLVKPFVVFVKSFVLFFVLKNTPNFRMLKSLRVF